MTNTLHISECYLTVLFVIYKFCWKTEKLGHDSNVLDKEDLDFKVS